MNLVWYYLTHQATDRIQIEQLRVRLMEPLPGLPRRDPTILASEEMRAFSMFQRQQGT